MNRYLLAALLLLSLVTLNAMTVDEVPNVHLDSRSRYVSDPAGILGKSTVDNLDASIGRVWDATTAEMVVVVVDKVDPSLTPHEFGVKLFEKWKIGKNDNDNGLLLLVSRDDRRAEIVTGYGMEGVVPDIIAGRVIRDRMAPHFKAGDYDAGVSAGVDELARIITDRRYAEELRSSIANDSRRYRKEASGDEMDFTTFFMYAEGVILLLALVVYISTVRSARRLPQREQYMALESRKPVMLALTVASLGLGLVFFIPFTRKMKKLRRGVHKCPNCATAMTLIDEVHDNDYLTPAQDMEERLDSVDYDVWVCPRCNETDIIPYVNRSSAYTVCPRCGARACALSADRRVIAPTAVRDGQGVRVYTCRNCGNNTQQRYTIPKVVAPVVVGGIGGFGGGGGGGFSGGSFGGGATGGGGAGGSW